MWNHQSKWTIRFCVAAAVMLWLQMAFYGLFKALRLPAFAGFFDMCNSWLMRWRMPFLAVLLDVLVWSTLTIGISLAMVQLFSYWKVKARLNKTYDMKLSLLLARRYSLHHKQLMVVASKESIALTMGFFRPVIIISTGLIQLLDEAELEAVIRHEEFHLNQYDSVRTFFTYFLFKTMWYLPILKWCHQYYRTSREVLADQYAVTRTGSAIGLGSALLKLIKHNPAQQMSFAHASFADTPLNVRIQSLIDPQIKAGLRPPLFASMVSLHVLLLLIALLLPAYL